MVVGAAAVELKIHGSSSLKERRGVVQSLCGRVRSRFNLAVAEVGGQDTWQRAVVGLAAVGSDAALVRRVLERALAFVEEQHLAEVLHAEIEILPLPYAEGEDAAAGPLPWDEE